MRWIRPARWVSSSCHTGLNRRDSLVKTPGECRVFCYGLFVVIALFQLFFNGFKALD